MTDALVYPMLAHVLLTAMLYAALTVARAPAVWNLGANSDGTNPFEVIEPRITANLKNQFEWPVFFYVVCLLAFMQELGSSAMLVGLAWLFVVGRMFHSAVQVFTANIRLRGLVFTVNFLAVIGMWFYVVFRHAA